MFNLYTLSFKYWFYFLYNNLSEGFGCFPLVMDRRLVWYFVMYVFLCKIIIIIIIIPALDSTKILRLNWKMLLLPHWLGLLIEGLIIDSKKIGNQSCKSPRKVCLSSLILHQARRCCSNSLSISRNAKAQTQT